MQTQSSSTLIVVEVGGEWPRWLPVLAEAPVETVLQQEGETCGAFADRVKSVVAGLARVGAPHLAVLACSERADEPARTARRAVAISLLSAMAPAGAGSLLFTESQRQSGGSRAMLSSLATDLSEEWEDLGLHVSVRFGQPSRPPQESSGADSPRV